jgi:hypothetical protein
VPGLFRASLREKLGRHTEFPSLVAPIEPGRAMDCRVEPGNDD